MAFKIYSVESRKGGVGKTTIALNLGKQLLSKGPVLMLDCDITGTSISDPASNSIYWKDDANVLKDPNGQPYNILGYFLDKFIRGNGNMNDFINSDMLQERKINVIGSQLYASTLRAIADTRLLMDEIHSYWLVVFVRSIIEAFENYYSGKTVHVIVDNSPGYVGFCQALHNYMLKLGPETAKFLMVSSIDEQDLKSCIYACREIRDMIDTRLSAVVYYKRQLEGQSSDPNFERELIADSELKKFYFSLMDDKQMMESYSNARLTEKNYLALVLNKVPRSLYDDNFDYNFENVIPQEDMHLFKSITSANESEPQTIIYYDEAISYQYYIKYLRSKTEYLNRDRYWSSRFKDLENRNAEYAQLTDRIEAIGKEETIFSNLMTNLSQRGYSRVARSIPDTWNPSYELNKLEELLIKISYRTFSTRRIELSEGDRERISRYNNRNLQSAKHRCQLVEKSEELNALFCHIDKITRGDEDFDKRQYAVKSLFLHVTLKLIIECCNNKDSLRQALLDDLRAHPFGYSWHEYVDNKLVGNLQIGASDLPVEMFFQHFFDKFHSYFCLTIVRLMDMHKDFNNLLATLRQYIPNTSPLIFSRELIDYLTNVIVYKVEEFDEDKLITIKGNAFVMKRVQEVVKEGILKNWK